MGGGRTVGMAAAVTALALLCAIPPSLTAEVDIKRFIARASIRYETTFTLDTSLERWNRMLNDPVFMAVLWNQFEFSPPYRIVQAGTAFHVADPTGLTGLVTVTELTPARRVYLGKGRIRNWMVPVAISGRALVIVSSGATAGGRTAVRFEVYGEEGDNRAARVLLKVVGPVLTRLIGRRITRNAEDLGMLARAIEERPGEVRERLPVEWRPAFDRLTAPITGVSLAVPREYLYGP